MYLAWGWDKILFCQDFLRALKHINGLITTPACRKHGPTTFFTRQNSLNDFKLVLQQSVLADSAFRDHEFIHYFHYICLKKIRNVLIAVFYHSNRIQLFSDPKMLILSLKS